jgi:hypothetical protein
VDGAVPVRGDGRWFRSHRLELGEFPIGDVSRRSSSASCGRGWSAAATARSRPATPASAGWTLHSAGQPTDRMREVMTIIYYAAARRPANHPYRRFDRDVARRLRAGQANNPLLHGRARGGER